MVPPVGVEPTTRAYKQVIVLLDHRKVSDSIRILHVKHVLASILVSASFVRTGVEPVYNLPLD